MRILFLSIWWKTFFVHCTQHNDIVKYKDDLNESIYTCMEMSHQSYSECMLMPFKRFQDYLIWKSRLEEEKQKRINEEIKVNGKSFR